MEVTAAVFARMCGVGRANISLLKKANSPKIVFNSAGLLDTDNPVNRMYMERHQAKMKTKLELDRMEAAVADSALFGATEPTLDAGVPTAVPPNDTETAAVSSAPPTHSGATNRTSQPAGATMPPASSAAEMLRLPVGQLVRKFGSVDAIEKYSKILRDLSTADEREQRTQEKRLLQIPKDFVIQRVFGYMDSLMGQLLDVPETVSDQVIAVAMSGGDDVRVKVMHIISDSLTRCISGAKEHITGELNALKGKYDKRDSAVQELVAQEMERMGEAG